MTAFNNPHGRVPVLQTVPMPMDTIAKDYISAGWLLSQMDLAGGASAYDYVRGRTVTVGVEAMSFHRPVHVGDALSVYADVQKVGRSSIAIKIEAWARRRGMDKQVKVTEGLFTFVAIDGQGRPVEIEKVRNSNKKAPPRPLKRQNGAPDGMPSAEKPCKPCAEPAGSKGKNLSIRTIPLPRDANYLGDIFGGWILSQMDLAAHKEAEKFSGKRVATVGLDSMTFHKPVFIGDEVSFYTEVAKVGRTSVTIKVVSYACRANEQVYEKVTEGYLTYVAIDNRRKPMPICAKP